MSLALGTMGRVSTGAMAAFAHDDRRDAVHRARRLCRPARPAKGWGSLPDAADPNSQTFAKPSIRHGRAGSPCCVWGSKVGDGSRIDRLQRPVHSFYTYGPTETLYPEDV